MTTKKFLGGALLFGAAVCSLLSMRPPPEPSEEPEPELELEAEEEEHEFLFVILYGRVSVRHGKRTHRSCFRCRFLPWNYDFRYGCVGVPALHHHGRIMRLPPANCPACNSLQRLARHERQIGNSIQVYTRCSACRSEFVLEVLTVEEKRQRQRAERERRHALRSQSRLRRWPSRP